MRIPLFFLACLAALGVHATIHRVNNTGIDADFTALQVAHDAAVDGDTLHVEPSGTSYGSCTFIKPLVVIGPGYFLSLNAGLQANAGTAITGALVFEAGSEGCVVSGLDVQGPTQVKAGFVRIERCRFSGGGMDLHIAYNFPGLSLSGIVVNGCHVANTLNVGANGSTVLDVTISNTYARTLNLANGSGNSGEVLNCYLAGSGTTALFGAAGYTVTNCILGPLVSPSAAAFANNIFAGAPVPATNGNVLNADLGTVFVGGSGDAQYQLAAGSVAIGAGSGGVDCGLFGGAEPYTLSGIPPVPSIFSLTAPTSTDQGTPLQVTIGARAND
ncbi:MAG TPA: hypothetical protein PKE21_01645 [Flavobacteriales bacterium]|nr:hypothetical protein [Flavobacteriales bacterium]HMR26157.1 hypothetical protein [Flavobacteriales bacterium]